LVERKNRQVLEALRPICNGHSQAWEDWIPQVQACVNTMVNSHTGKTPHFVIYGTEKRLPTELLNSAPTPIYSDDFISTNVAMFKRIYKEVREKLEKSRDAMTEKTNVNAKPVEIELGDAVMLLIPDRTNKLSAKFSGPYIITHKHHANKFTILDPTTSVSDTVHCDRLKKVARDILPKPFPSDSNANDTVPVSTKPKAQPNPEYVAKLRSHTSTKPAQN
jgi:hypothetical protein